MGELSGLEGEGAPLPDDEPDRGDGAWAARHIMRNANVAPQWAELRREIDARRERIAGRLRAHRRWLADRGELLRTVPAERILDVARRTSDRDAEVSANVDAALAELNVLVARYNLHVAMPLQLPSVTREKL
jgi:DnaJ-like protein